jgi:hypothetical protein
MLQTLKISVAILVGAVLGLLIALPLAWYASRMGADTLKKNVWNAAQAVQDRQQAMADQALKQEPLLKSFGQTGNADVYADIQDERSRLVGVSELEDKLLYEQRLEEALLRGEKVALHAGADSAKLAGWEPYREDRRIWEKQKRLLVREQKTLADSVEEFNGLLDHWPFNTLLAHDTFAGLVNAVLNDFWNNVVYLTRLSLDWAGYGMRRLASLVGQQTPPERPRWGYHPKARTDKPYAVSFARLVFLADAPLPEDDYNELQYTHELKENYADVELGEDKAVLENRESPKGYEAPLPKPQMTVVYSAQN